MVIVLKLMPHCQDHHVGGVLNLVQGNVAGAAKRDHHFSKKRAVPCLAVDKRRAAAGQGVDAKVSEPRSPARQRRWSPDGWAVKTQCTDTVRTI